MMAASGGEIENETTKTGRTQTRTQIVYWRHLRKYRQILNLSRRRPQKIVVKAHPGCLRTKCTRTTLRGGNEDFLFHTLGISLQHDLVVLARVTEESSDVTTGTDGFEKRLDVHVDGKVTGSR